MESKPSKALMAIMVLFALSYLCPSCLSDTSCSYELLEHFSSFGRYSLNVAVSQSLYDYYVGRSHRMNSDYDFARFVTPYALKPIADRLLEIYQDDEDFANAVLMIVHQIPYEATVPTKYPVETIVENKGDCDLLSLIAASIMKAAGFGVVLFYYKSESHMNVGVSLSHEPRDARETAYYIEHNNARYYVAECTGGNWQTGWRIAECPDELEHSSVQVIDLGESEQTAPAQVSASYRTLSASALSLTVSPAFIIQGNLVTVSGGLSPALEGKSIAIYISLNSQQWTVLNIVTTDSHGQFKYTWDEGTGGICSIRASWSGDESYAGADSQIQTITILSTFFIAIIAMAAILISVGVVVFLMTRRNSLDVQTSLPLEVS